MVQSLAVLVDGDNVSGKNAEQVLSIAARYGDPIVVRAYLDAQRSSDWHGAAGYRLLHAGTGKNASDLLLSLDAMELVMSGRIMNFVIATSDGDFSHLSIRLREHGARVIGVGEAKAPQTFRASCADFVELAPVQRIRLVPRSAPTEMTLDQKICAMIAAQGKKGAGLPITVLGRLMHQQHKIGINTFPEKNWRSYLAARPHLYSLDPRGPDAKVRALSDHSIQAA